LPINVTSISISISSSGSGVQVYLFAYHVPSTATSCSADAYDTTLWHVRDAGDGVTPVSFSFPTPLQWKPPPNTKACLQAVVNGAGVTLNAVGFYGG
jgi:hypothetical protein